jgi:hypothetical protein
MQNGLDPSCDKYKPSNNQANHLVRGFMIGLIIGIVFPILEQSFLGRRVIDALNILATSWLLFLGGCIVYVVTTGNDAPGYGVWWWLSLAVGTLTVVRGRLRGDRR